MNTEFIVLITVVICFAAFATAMFLVQYLSKHGLSASGIAKVETGITMASAVAAAIKPFLPGYADNVIDTVLKYAQEGVTRAESTYKAALAVGADANDTRAAEAETWIKDALALQGISITADVQKLIDAVIPLFVRALPPTHETIGAEK
jgi:ABC-type Fe3+-siderophore transport system permease subunit